MGQCGGWGMGGLIDLEGLFQPNRFCDSLIRAARATRGGDGGLGTHREQRQGHTEPCGSRSCLSS